MPLSGPYRLFCSCFFLFLCLSYSGFAQRQPISDGSTFVVSGTVTDARTGVPVPFAGVALKGRKTGVTANEQGQFMLRVQILSDSLLVSSLGFTTKTVALDPSVRVQVIVVALLSAGMSLQEVMIKSGENPAYRVLRQLRQNVAQNDRSRIDSYEHDSYAKTEIALSHVTDKMRRNPLLRRVAEAMTRFDTLIDDNGHQLLPVFVSESVSTFYHRQTPQRNREDIRKTRVQGVGIADPNFVAQFVGGNSLSYNFYDNYQPFLGKDFASPMGENWKNWYEYFIADTVWVGNHVCYEIQFDPRRKQDLVFTGTMWIDTTVFALCQIEARIGAEANINYVRQLLIEQDLEPVVDAAGQRMGWLPISLRMTAELTGVGQSSLGIRARSVTRNANFRINQNRPISFFDRVVTVADTAQQANDTYWKNAYQTLAGPDSLDRDDRVARRLLDSLKQVPAVRRAEAISQILLTGWYKVGPVDFGPYLLVAAFNQVEGLRMRAGFRTNSRFSRSVTVRSYVGYGIKDARFKYGLELNYQVSRRKWTVVGGRLSSDLERLGITPELTNNNPAFFAFSRFGRFRGGFYNDQRELFLLTEPIKGVLLTATVGSRTFFPTFAYQFRIRPEMGDNSPTRPDFYDAFYSLEARVARKENYIMEGNDRVAVGTWQSPVFTVRYTHGSRALGGDFSYDRLSLKLAQMIPFGQLGRTTYLFQAGYTPSTVPAPLLFPHTGNPTFFFVANAFNRMDFYEFVSDRFAMLHWQHRFEGLLFNRIPGIKKLNWRLTANADLLWGSRRADNRAYESDKELSPGVKPTVFGSLDSRTPYVELGYGIDNIFKIVRIQAVHRLTYLQPGVDKFVIKGALQFSF